MLEVLCATERSLKGKRTYRKVAVRVPLNEEGNYRTQENSEKRVDEGARTLDNWSHNPVLYQLSYIHRQQGSSLSLSALVVNRASA